MKQPAPFTHDSSGPPQRGKHSAVTGSHTNPCRHEDAVDALRRGEVAAAVWSAHPRLYRVRAHPDIAAKITAVRDVLEQVSASWPDAAP